MKNNEYGLIPALQMALQSASSPLDYNQLYAIPAIKAHTMTALQVADALGTLWNKGCLSRQYEPGKHHARGRWLYRWRNGVARTCDDLEPQAECMTVEIGGMVVTVSVSVRSKSTGFDYVDAVVGC